MVRGFQEAAMLGMKLEDPQEFSKSTEVDAFAWQRDSTWKDMEHETDWCVWEL